MKMLELLPIGNLDARLLQNLAPALADAFRVPCRIAGERLDPQFAFHAERQQYHSSEILQAMQDYAGEWRVASARRDRRRSLHSDSDVRLRRSADGRPVRRRFLSSAAAGVLRPAGGPRRS